MRPEYLRMEREEVGMDLEFMARYTGYDVDELEAIENGTLKVSEYEMNRIYTYYEDFEERCSRRRY